MADGAKIGGSKPGHSRACREGGGSEPSQGRVSRAPWPRAPEPTVADAHRAPADVPSRRRIDETGARGARTAGPPPDATGRRPSRRFASHEAETLARSEGGEDR